MRRQRVLRQSSAQSLCIFCACRLGIEPLPTPVTPFRSATARRGIRTAPNPLQSAAPASAPPPSVDDNGNPSPGFPFDPRSSLTHAEQQEKARRLEAQRQREAETQQAKQQQIWRETERRRQSSVPGGSNIDQQKQPKTETAFTKVLRRGTSEGESAVDGVLESAGQSLSQAMTGRPKGAPVPQDTSQARESDPQPARNAQRTHAWKTGDRVQKGVNITKYAVQGGNADENPAQSRKQNAANARDGNHPRETHARPSTRGPRQVANPFAAPVKKETAPAEQSTTSGWGMGATQTVSGAAEEPAQTSERKAVIWDDGVDRPPASGQTPGQYDSGGHEDLVQADPTQSPGWTTFRPTLTASEASQTGPEVRPAANSNISSVSSHQPEPTQPYQDSAEVQSADAGPFAFFDDASLKEEPRAQEQEPHVPPSVGREIEDLSAGGRQRASSTTSPQAVDWSNAEVPQASYQTNQTLPRAVDSSNVQSSEAPRPSPAQQTHTTPPTSSYGQDELQRLQQELDEGEITQKGYDKRKAVIIELQQLQRDFDEGEITQKGFDKRRAAILARQGNIAPAQASTGSTPSRSPDTAQESRGIPDPRLGLGRMPIEEIIRPKENINRTVPRTDFTGTGYRTTPFDPSELRQTIAADQDNSSTWQHLRPRKTSVPPQQQPVPPQEPQKHTQQQQPPQRRPREDYSDIDQIFEAHRQSRPQRPAVQQTETHSYNLFASPQQQTKRCARCGEIGHIARNCPGPHRNITCHKCGQKGHLAPRCPNRDVPAIQDAPPRSSNFARRDDRYEQGARHAGRNADPSAVPYRYTLMDTSEGQEEFSPLRESRFTTLSDVDEEEDSKKASKASRRAQKWADVEDEPETDRYADRKKGRRSNRREFDEDADDDEGARDVYRQRKAKRQAEEEAETRKREKAAREKRQALKAQQSTPITLPEYVSVQQLSQLLSVRYEEFVERLEELGYDDVFPGKTLNAETSGMIAMEFNFEPNYDVVAREEEERDLKPRPEVEDKEFLPTRPPVVTIMGHVDHGKTTILDYLRKSSVAAGEAGGITQHIGAFSVPMSSSGKTVTFLDTPGHAAFLAMRQRGANVTDIVVLVVAADDSVKPQTLEAIKHAKAAGVPMIVAINKVDKEEADIQRCKQDLARHGVEIEDYGGDTQVVCVSGKTGKGMDELEENVVTLSEILDHRAETDGSVEGWVLEATTKRAGRVATVLVRRGTLRPGSVIVAGKTWARVRTLRNEGGQTLHEIGPGMPVEVDGWKDQPTAGDEVLQAPNEQKATSVVEYRLECDERARAAKDMEAINEARRIQQEKHEKGKAAERAAKRAAFAARAEGLDREAVSAAKGEPDEKEQQSGQMIVPFIIKADVSGSAEAVSTYIMSVSNPLIAPQILQSNVGGIHESDIELAHAASGHIIAFNLPSDPDMQALAESRGVKVLENNIIYRVLDDVKAVLEEKLPPIVTQRVIGEADVGAAFEIGVGGRKKIKIAGCKVRNGVVGMRSRVRVMRGGEKVYDGTISSLKNVKKDVQEMRKGTECGMGFEGWERFEVGDQVQTYEEVSERRKL